MITISHHHSIKMKFNPKQLNEKKMYPSHTAGSGRARPNSLKTGEGHGKKSPKLIYNCAQCGHPVDINRTDHSGGTLTGNGGLGPITVTDGVGESSVRKGAGCPLCGSKNFLGKT